MKALRVIGKSLRFAAPLAVMSLLASAHAQPLPDVPATGSAPVQSPAPGAPGARHDTPPSDLAPASGAPPADASPAAPSDAAVPGATPAAAPPAEAAGNVPAERASAPPDQPAQATAAIAGITSSSSAKIVYVLERIEVRGNTTRASVIRRFVPLKPGDPLDVDDPAIEQIRFRLMGTGWFDEVRLSLQRGEQHGHVVLVVEVQERNTLVVSRVVAGLSRVVRHSTTNHDTVAPYFGLGLTESNLLGLGLGVGASAVVTNAQYGLDFRYHDPMLAGTSFDLNARAFYNHAREYFGRHPLVSIQCPPPDPTQNPPEPCDPDVLGQRAVVIYNRGGFGFGTGHDITPALRYEVDWLGELVHVMAKPSAADTTFGAHNEERVPIDFHIDDGTSRVSSLHLGLIFDRRDDPALPSQGQLLRLDARIGTSLLGSTYDFARIEASFRHFQPLPWHHVISFGAYLGTVFGRAPFFYLFYAADLSDLLPARALELNLDHRRTHNLLGTSIAEFDKEDLASRLDFEYDLPLHRGGGDIRAVHAYAGAGLFLLADRNALRLGIPGYSGLSALPVDLTFDLGVQADTVVGLFKIGFSTLIGFLPDLGRPK